MHAETDSLTTGKDNASSHYKKNMLTVIYWNTSQFITVSISSILHWYSISISIKKTLYVINKSEQANNVNEINAHIQWKFHVLSTEHYDVK